MNQNFRKSVFSAIVYFDIFDFPLTLIELYEYALDFSEKTSKDSMDLYSFFDFIQKDEWLSKRIKNKNGFYYLRGRDSVLKTRRERYRFSKIKFESALFWVKIISKIPFARALFLSNSTAVFNAKEESDIDLVVITSKGGAWWARFLILSLLSVFKARPGNKSTRNKICISVFAEEGLLDFSKYKIGRHDIDYVYWACDFYPIWDSKRIYDSFWDQNSKWIFKNLPFSEKKIPHPSFFVKNKIKNFKIFECLLVRFSKIVEIFQRAKFPKQIKEMANKDTRVRVENGFLKFHVNDKRMEHLQKFVKRYEQYSSVSKI